MSNELISKIIWRTNFLFGCLFCFLYFLVNWDNIKVYFSIVTHEIPLRVRKKTRRTQCTIRSAVNHLQNLFNVKTVSWKLFKFYSRSKTTTITDFILDEIKRSISISVYYGWKLLDILPFSKHLFLFPVSVGVTCFFNGFVLYLSLT